MHQRAIEVHLHLPPSLVDYKEDLQGFILEIDKNIKLSNTFSPNTHIVISLVSQTLSDVDKEFYTGYTQKNFRFLFYYFQDSEISIDDFSDKVFERVEFREALQKESNLSYTFSSIQEIKSTLEKNLKESLSDLQNRTNYSKINAHIINRSKGDKFYNNDNNLRKVDNFLRRAKRVALINGLGGVGKTTLAIEYATNTLEEGIYDYAIWFDVENGISAEIKKFAISYLLDDREDGKQKDSFYQTKFSQFLTDYPNSLIILDNLEYKEPYKKELEEFLREFGKIDVIITSRQAITQHEIYPLELDVFKNEYDGLEMFKLTSSRQYSRNEDVILKEIINHLGKLPLALEITANFLSEFTDMSVQEYLDALKAEGLKLFTKIEDYNHLKSLRATLTINDKISKNSKNSNALKLLKIFSIISPEVIEQDIIDTHLMKVLDISSFDKSLVLKDLERFSYIKLSKEGYTMHRLLQEAIRDELFENDEEKVEAIRDVSLAIFWWFYEGLLISKYGNYFATTVYHIEYILEKWKILESNEIKIYLYTCLSAYAKNIGKNLIEHLGEIKIIIKLLDKTLIDNEVKSIIYSEYGNILHSNKKYVDAKKIQTKALKLSTQKRILSVIYENLARTHTSLKEYDNAKIVYDKALYLYQEMFGVTYSRISIIYHDLGIIYFKTKKYLKSEKYYSMSLDISIQIFDKHHPHTALIYCSLGTLYKDMSHYIKSFNHYFISLVISLDLEKSIKNNFDIQNAFNGIKISRMKIERLDNNQKRSLNKKIEELNTLSKEKGLKHKLKKIK